jgi:hypothetical protein
MKLLLMVVAVLSAALGLKIYLAESDYTVVPVGLSSADLPFVEVFVEEKPYFIAIDLGSFQELELFSTLLEPATKTFCGVDQWTNYKGIEYHCLKYLLPKVKIGSLTFKKVAATASIPGRERDSTIWENPTARELYPNTVGSLGRNFFKKKSILLDMQNSRMVLTSGVKKIEKAGYNLDLFLKLPFTESSLGIVLDVETDLGKKRLLLDTGFTYTMLHEFLYPEKGEKKRCSHDLPILTSHLFGINDVDFGEQDLHFIKMARELEAVDGMIGMDFIKNHVIYIDFPRKILYLEKPRQ